MPKNESYKEEFMVSGQDMDIDTSMSTPIKKIKGLTLASPIYPNMNDFQPQNIANQMVNKGYSQKLTNNVLEELNSRASDITLHMRLSPSNGTPITSASRRNKRYSGIHRAKFNKMESISNHYSVMSRDIDAVGTRNDDGKMQMRNVDTINKKRRTLNGKEDILKPSPVKYTVPPTTSPDKQTPQSSPLKRISPSKKSMNLNKLLNDGEEKRMNSLQTAGVGHMRPQIGLAIPKLSKKSSISSMNNQSSTPRRSVLPELQSSPYAKYDNEENKENRPILRSPSTKSQMTAYNKPNAFQKPHVPYRNNTTSLSNKLNIPPLSHKLSIPSLSEKPKPSLSHKLSIPSLSQKLSIPSLSHKLSIPSLSHNSTMSLSRKLKVVPLDKPTSQVPKSKSAYNDSIRMIPKQEKQPMHKSTSFFSRELQPKKYTIPQPFSLYNKPTVSSSQKSLNKFQRFKDKFN